MKISKKVDFGNSNSQIAILALNQCSISVVFPIVRFAGDQKTALSGESLYLVYLKVFPINYQQGEESRRGGGVIALKYPLLLSRK